MSDAPLRIVTFNFVPFAYDLVTNWIQQNNHKHVLAVTTPGPTTRPTPSYQGIVTNAPRNVDILVTTRLRNVATPLIRALEPDLIVSFTFPYRITPELCSIPRYGAVNLHPTVLPAYRGPNVMRPFYEGASIYGATLHWTAEEYDTGNILSQKSASMPNELVVGDLFPGWMKLMAEAFTEGVDRALAGDPGTPQDDALSSYAAPFTEAEKWIDLTEPRRVIQRKATALNMLGAGSAKVMLEQKPHQILALEIAAAPEMPATPGQLLEKDGDKLTVSAGDGPIRLQVEAL